MMISRKIELSLCAKKDDLKRKLDKKIKFYDKNNGGANFIKNWEFMTLALFLKTRNNVF